MSSTHELRALRPALARHLPELDGMRALSALGVITAHMHTALWDWLSGGRGVLIFFTISGFLITRLGLQEEARQGRVHLGAFFIRRLFRLLPAYLVVLALYSVVIASLDLASAKRALWMTALPYYLTGLPEIPGVLGLDGVRHDIAFSHSWSLGIEAKFYLCYPPLMFGLLAAKRAWRLPLTVGLCLLFLSTPFWGIGPVAAILHPYASILVGCVVALVLDHRAWSRLQAWLTRRHATTAALVAFVLTHAAFTDTDATVWSSYDAILRSAYIVVFAWLFATIVLGRSRVKRWLQARWLVYIGQLSYGVYLLHILCLNVAERALGVTAHSGLAVNVLCFLLTAVLAVAGAALMHAVVEAPCIRFGQDQARRLSPRHAEAVTTA